MQSRTNMALVGGLAVLVASLIVGQRLGFDWAGGTGYEAPQTAFVEEIDGMATVHALGAIRPLKTGDRLRRGETVETGNETYLEISFQNGSRLALDPRTDATLETMSDAETTIRMTHGRLVSRNDFGRRFTVRTNETESTMLAGTFTVIDEAERAVVHIIPLDTFPISIIVHRENGFVATTPQEVHEIAPYEVTNGSYRLVDSAANFYRRFGINPYR